MVGRLRLYQPIDPIIFRKCGTVASQGRILYGDLRAVQYPWRRTGRRCKVTTADMVRTNEPCPIINDMFNNFVERAVFWKRRILVPVVSQPREQLEEGCGNIAWLNPTMEAIMALPWEEKNLPDDRQPPEPGAAAQLLWAMIDVLEVNTIPPTSIVPTSRGGVTAEWHVNGYDLDIVSDPDGSVLYYFLDPNGDEYEGPGEESMQEIRNFVHSLPSKRN